MTNPKTIKVRIQNELMHTMGSEWATATINQRNALWTKTLGVVERLDTKYDAILANRSLSPTGQQNAIAALATDFVPEFTFLERVVNGLDKTFANTPLFTVKPVVTDPVVRQLRNQEIRDGVRGLNANEQDLQFLQAAQQDNDEVLDAILDAPGGMLVSADRKQRALEARAERLHPEAYAQWGQDTLYRAHVNSLRAQCAMCLVSMGADSKRVVKELGPTSTLVDESAA